MALESWDLLLKLFYESFFILKFGFKLVWSLLNLFSIPPLHAFNGLRAKQATTRATQVLATWVMQWGIISAHVARGSL